MASAAGVQAPTLYRLFGDKDGMIDALVLHGFETYLAEKAVRRPSPDPVQDLRTGWDLHVAFGLANPGLYALMYGEPRPGRVLPATAAARRILAEHVARRRRGRPPARPRGDRPRRLIHAMGSGTVLSLLALERGPARSPSSPRLLARAAIAAVTTDAPAIVPPPNRRRPRSRCAQRLAQTDGAERARTRALLAEWLARIADAPSAGER